jgi:tetratricopeptide (TPR) repeat protein
MKQPTIILVAVLCLAAGALLGQTSSSSPASKPASMPSTAAAEEQLYLEWAKKVEKTINAGDPSFLNKSMDVRAMVDKGLKGLDIPVPEYSRFVGEALRECAQAGLGDVICKELKNGGKLRFLRFHQVEAQTIALFRSSGTANSLNYHDFYLSVDQYGRAVANDVYYYSTGERISELFRINGRRFVLIRQGGAEANQLKQGLAKLDEMERLYRDKKFKEALAAYDSIPDRLPGSLKYDKPALSLRMLIAMQVSVDAYQKAMEDYRATFPADPALDMDLIELYFLWGEYDECIAAIDRLNQNIGGDPFLDMRKAMALFLAGRTDLAKAAALKAIKEEPTLVQAYDVLLVHLLAENDFKDAVLVLRARESAGLPMPDLTRQERFTDFVESPEYAAWIKSRKPHPTSQP